MLASGFYNCDCMDGMAQIEDKSIDLVLTDPPYNIGKASWDKIPNYIEWCGKWILECQRVLKDNGSFYFWHNDMVQIAQLMEWIRKNTRFVFNSFVIWDKGDFRALSWKNPSDANNLRSWFNTCEYCLYYTFQDETGLSAVMLDTNNFPTMRGYFKGLQDFIGANKKQILVRIGQNADHCFRWNSTQWDIPTQETYQQLIDTFNIRAWDGFREYESLRKEYESLRKEYESLRKEYESLRYTHNLDKCHNNVLESCEHNNGKRHVCRKPVDLLERIIKTSSNSGDTVLDCFAGSGATGEACLKTGRKYIMFENDQNIYASATECLERAKAQVGLLDILPEEKPEQMRL